MLYVCSKGQYYDRILRLKRYFEEERHSHNFLITHEDTNNPKDLVFPFTDDEEFAGGIVAILETATIENSKNTGNVIGSTNIGGIAGESKGTITQCRNDGQVSKVAGVICKTVNLGGLVGKNGEAARLSNSKNYGNVNSETDTLVNLGGICGILYNNSIVELCENNGAISGSGKEIIPNEDTNTNCASCTSNNGGSASTDDFGQLNIGIIYGKYQEI